MNTKVLCYSPVLIQDEINICNELIKRITLNYNNHQAVTAKAVKDMVNTSNSFNIAEHDKKIKKDILNEVLSIINKSDNFNMLLKEIEKIKEY